MKYSSCSVPTGFEKKAPANRIELDQLGPKANSTSIRP